jgi:cAMP phosphodiesterase
LPGDEDVLRGATIREVSQAVFSSESARRTWRLYKTTVQRSVSQEELVQEFSERQSVVAEFLVKSALEVGSYSAGRREEQCQNSGGTSSVKSSESTSEI